jgi:hypothetical protein
MLCAAGRNEDEPAHRSVPGVPDGVGRPPRHEDEATGGDWALAVSEQERGVAVRDVERFVSVGGRAAEAPASRREGRMFVIGVNPCMHADQIPPSISRPDALYPAADREREDGWLLPGNTVVVDPTATVLAARWYGRSASSSRSSIWTSCRPHDASSIRPGITTARMSSASRSTRERAPPSWSRRSRSPASSAGNPRIPSVAVEPPPRPSERQRPGRQSADSAPLVKRL